MISSVAPRTRTRIAARDRDGSAPLRRAHRILPTMTPSRRLLSLPAYAWDKSRWWNESSDWREGRLAPGGRGLLDVRLPRATPTWIARLDGRHMAFLKDHKVENHRRLSRRRVCRNGAGSGRAVVRRTAFCRRGLSKFANRLSCRIRLRDCTWSSPMIRRSARSRSRASSTKALRGRCMSWAPCAESARMQALLLRPGSARERPAWNRSRWRIFIVT